MLWNTNYYYSQHNKLLLLKKNNKSFFYTNTSLILMKYSNKCIGFKKLEQNRINFGKVSVRSES